MIESIEDLVQLTIREADLEPLIGEDYRLATPGVLSARSR